MLARMIVSLGAGLLFGLGLVVSGSGSRPGERPRFSPKIRGPTTTVVDRPLIAGAVLFGIGWGLVGYCPGPALASLSLGRTETGIFVAAMLAGMAAYRLFEALTSVNRRKAPTSV